MDDAIPFAGREYFILLAILVFSRGADFLSTWVATPHLLLEGNPIAKWLGWKWGAAVNGILVLSLAMWPLTSRSASILRRKSSTVCGFVSRPQSKLWTVPPGWRSLSS